MISECRRSTVATRLSGTLVALTTAAWLVLSIVPTSTAGAQRNSHVGSGIQHVAARGELRKRVALIQFSTESSQHTFPKRTLIGAAIGAVIGGARLAIAAEGKELFPSSKERNFFFGCVGVGAVIGFVAERR